ncbi:MAG TPA: phosphoribosyltransferase [Phycisphaerales bacterium]|nr:phosphoribosyltransferase [Phycisphaerales bacterium]
MGPIFADRHDAGRRLGRALARYGGRGDVTVLGLARGGVVVAYEVAEALQAPLDVLVVRKLGVPGHEELAMGAIASGGVRVLSRDLIGQLGISGDQLAAVTAAETAELARRELAFRGGRGPLDVRGRTVLLVDDGLATGSTMRSAAEALRQLSPARVVVAVPVGAPETCDAFRGEVDEVVCGVTPEPFYGVGMWYEDFSQTSDDEVRMLLERSRTRSEVGA